MGEQRTALILLLVLCFAVSFSEMGILKAEPKTIVVPDDFSTITDAVGNATEGDLVFIKKGTYNEPSIVINKPLTIIGEDANATIINNIDKLEWDFVNPFPPNTITLEVISNETNICNLTLSSNSVYSIGISGKCDWATISGNIITTGFEGIILEGSNHLIMNNEMMNASLGMQVTGSYNIVMNNSNAGRIVLGRLPEVTADRAGIGDCHFNLVYGNFISSNGIHLSGSNSIIAENDVKRISISGSHNFVCANRITDGDGLFLGWGINNTICGNYVANNNVGALVVGGSRSVIENSDGAWITNNTVYHNNFMYNKALTWAGNPDYGLDYMYGVVTGYSGYPINNYDNGTEGNYWSDHKKADGNRDGIGDSPYLIDFSGNKDYHPLMMPFDLASVETEFPEWAQERISIRIIPEFPSWIILPLFMTATLLAIMYGKRVRERLDISG